MESSWKNRVAEGNSFVERIYSPGAHVRRSTMQKAPLRYPRRGMGQTTTLEIQKIKGLPGTPWGLNAVKIPGPPPGSRTLLQKQNPVTGREDFGH